MSALKPTVSVIVPCYQSEATLAETLRSVRRQTWKNWECIIVNDGSMDNTVAIAQRYCSSDRRFRLVSKENGGLSSARNAGIRICQGHFLNFLDSDDLLHRHAISSFMAGTRTHTDAHVYYTDFDVVDARGRYIATRYAPAEVCYASLCRGNAFSPHGALVRRAAIGDSSLFDESLNACEDWDFWLRLAERNCRFVKVARALVVYRHHPGTMSQDLRRMYGAMVYVINRHVRPSLLPDNESGENLLSPDEAHRAVVGQFLMYLGWSASAGDLDAFEQILREAASMLPGQPLRPCPLGSFVYGLHVGLGDPFSHKLCDLAAKSELPLVLPLVNRIEAALSLPGLTDDFLDEALSDYGRLARVYRRTLESHTFRVARVLARLSGAIRGVARGFSRSPTSQSGDTP